MSSQILMEDMPQLQHLHEVDFWHDERMPYVETRKACHSRICYKSHSHPTFSIGAVDLGQSRLAFHDHPIQIIRAGSVVSIPAHLEHGCNPLSEQAWSYQMMHLDMQWLTQLIQESVTENQCDIAAIPQYSAQVLNNPQLYQAFTQLNLDLFDPLKTIFEKEQALIEVLSQILLPSLAWQKIDFSRVHQLQIQHLLAFIGQADDFVRLETLAEQIDASRFVVIRLFKHFLGLTPHAFQLNNRIHQARELIKQGQSILIVAHHLGFCDQSHFHRVFKAHTGVTPKQYQQKFKSAI
ncbi:AraC-like DNA-binding protein [Acinetobacter calcoaceticus]|uniref:AraC-like DNA-binding protein n=1 Tax=Acinetobacter calcoaceticus TaxID=471 RepID=A0A4R1XIK7_ACICA|nr:AraC-like DNA-binding protein [Acinetobacter calcoaceticus]